MEVVAVTGGCGMLGRHVIRKLADNPKIQEVRIMDRSNTRPESHLKLKYFQVELCNEAEVERALNGVDTVIHLAKADIPLIYQTKEEKDGMWRDNLQATEMLADKMVSMRIPRLIYVGDAYSSLPVGDNFGPSEEAHSNLPTTFLLGEYGESRARAEMYMRNVVKEESSLFGVFLRPTWIHSEMKSSFWNGLAEMAVKGQIPYVECERRGLHQFIYAGNLAALIENSIFRLQTEPLKVSNEVVYCTDDTNITSFAKFLGDRVRHNCFSKSSSSSFLSSYISHLYNHLLYKLNSVQTSSEQLHFHTYRTLFEKTIGFSDRKLRLFMKYLPEENPSVSMERTLNVFRSNERELYSDRVHTTQPMSIMHENTFVEEDAQKQEAFPIAHPRAARMG